MSIDIEADKSGNSGYGNSGYYNTGDRNIGHHNTGHYNIGHHNVGSYNTGYGNTGYGNTGHDNTGDGNIGDDNTGDYNTCNYSSGLFCTHEPEAIIFDRPAGMTVSKARNLPGLRVLENHELPLTYWVRYTEEEKQSDVGKRLIGGYLKERTYKEAWTLLWDELTVDEREAVKSLPNFDADKFEEITGISV